MTACRRERGRVRALRAGDESGRNPLRETEDLHEPVCGHLLDRGGHGRQDDGEAVLVPGGREPVRGDGGRQCAADHEAEVPSRLRPDDSRLAAGDQLCDHVLVVGTPVGQRPAELGAQLLERRLRRYGPIVERLVELRRVIGGQPEQVSHGVHRAPR
jgi:hypothetical protein